MAVESPKKPYAGVKGAEYTGPPLAAEPHEEEYAGREHSFIRHCPQGSNHPGKSSLLVEEEVGAQGSKEFGKKVGRMMEDGVVGVRKPESEASGWE